MAIQPLDRLRALSLSKGWIACMFNPMLELARGKAEGGFREWALQLVGGSRLRRSCTPGLEGLGCKDRDVMPTGRRHGAGPGRPIGLLRLDLLTKPWAPGPDLVKLEPLTEP